MIVMRGSYGCSNMPTQNASYTYEILKIHSSPKIPKANQMLVSYFPHITKV